jgi:hypothetical protein
MIKTVLRPAWLYLALLLPAANAVGQNRKVFTTTPTYDEIITAFTGFSRESPQTKLLTYGTTDAGKPLHLFVISKSRVFDPAELRKQGKRILLINNGIHPGEPDGIDASIELTKTLLSQPNKLPDNLVICIVPVFNVDGCLNRGSYSRANQNGPAEYGFRGNAKNLDLNRDFIKCDAENTKTLEQIFQEWGPDVFVDTHVSDGADYQYVMTLIATQRNKLNPTLSKYMTSEMVPSLYATMKEKKYDMCPYVNEMGETPETGIAEFMETPRFSTGYAALFNTLAFVTETHMWKPYNDRVWATYEFLLALVNLTENDAKKIGDLRVQANKEVTEQNDFVLNWQLDTLHYDQVDFKGYEALHKKSELGGERLYYDRSKPYTRKVKFYNQYTASSTVTRAAIYIVPQAWTAVIERLKLNKVEMKRLTKDTSMRVEVYYIDSYQTGKNPYEGHYNHHGTKVHSEIQKMDFHKGDYVIATNQAVNRYIVETLEPQGDDSFFAWNFFDGILQQKEWYSDYIFEDMAVELLRTDAALKKAYDEKMANDKEFASSGHDTKLAWIYMHSVYHEKSQNRYPVARLGEWIKLPVE